VYLRLCAEFAEFPGGDPEANDFTQGGPAFLVLVPVAGVRRVTVSAVDVIDVIAVADLFVAAATFVLMVVAAVHQVRFRRTLVPVALVFVMSMAIVQVVGVVDVADRDVIAARTVLVLVCLMRLVFDFDHRVPSFLGRSVRYLAAREGCSTVSCPCATASRAMCATCSSASA
jgi:hypothetical protein